MPLSALRRRCSFSPALERTELAGESGWTILVVISFADA
jgi:hypothetical protein